MIKLEGTGSPVAALFQFYDGGEFFALIHESGHTAGLYAASRYLRRSLRDPDRVLQGYWPRYMLRS